MSVQYVEQALPRSGIGDPVFIPALPLERGAICMCAGCTATRQRRDEMLRLGFRRAKLIHLSAKQRNLRMSKKASLTEAELRAVTNDILAMQPKAQ